MEDVQNLILLAEDTPPVSQEPLSEALPPPFPDGEAAVPETGGTGEDTAGDPPEDEVDYARMAAEDLAEIKRLDPAYAPAAHLSELPFARRFAQLRDLGLSVAEALAAARPRFERTDGRAHLTPVSPRGKRAPDGVLDRERMREARMLFGDLSEAEINALYRRVMQTND